MGTTELRNEPKSFHFQTNLEFPRKFYHTDIFHIKTKWAKDRIQIDLNTYFSISNVLLGEIREKSNYEIKKKQLFKFSKKKKQLLFHKNRWTSNNL